MKAKFEAKIKSDIGFKAIKFTKEEAIARGLIKEDEKEENKVE